jgi:hypothetical protein
MRRYMAVAVLCLAAAPAHAGELGAQMAKSIELGGFRGIVYYTKEHDGYRVVATVAEGEDGQPVRLVATLLESQGITISIPGKVGEASRELEISRVGGKLVIGSRIRAHNLLSATPDALRQ